ncbi:hypothetical protein RI367_004026 [Sorochytrium milnesiophthora]
MVSPVSTATAAAHSNNHHNVNHHKAMQQQQQQQSSRGARTQPAVISHLQVVQRVLPFIPQAVAHARYTLRSPSSSLSRKVLTASVAAAAFTYSLPLLALYALVYSAASLGPAHELRDAAWSLAKDDIQAHVIDQRRQDIYSAVLSRASPSWKELMSQNTLPIRLWHLGESVTIWTVATILVLLNIQLPQSLYQHKRKHEENIIFTEQELEAKRLRTVDQGGAASAENSTNGPSAQHNKPRVAEVAPPLPSNKNDKVIHPSSAAAAAPEEPAKPQQRASSPTKRSPKGNKNQQQQREKEPQELPATETLYETKSNTAEAGNESPKVLPVQPIVRDHPEHFDEQGHPRPPHTLVIHDEHTTNNSDSAEPSDNKPAAEKSPKRQGSKGKKQK